jgi:cobalt/nickel transport system ATP-binding protein
MSEKAIAIEDLFYSYPGEEACLRGISFSVDRGETFGLIGPNGAGKSTLLLHMNGVLRGEGRVEVFGRPLTKDTVRLIRRQVGIVFQDPNDQLFMPTVFDNVAFGPANMDLDRAEVELRTGRMLEAMGLSGYADRPADKLSLGEKKKVSLASVLVMEPDVLALDEPTANLDPGGRRTLIQLLRSIPGTKVIATHDLDMAFELCTRIALMDQGTIVAAGAAGDILADGGLLEKHNLEVPLSLLIATGARPRTNSGWRPGP